MLWGALLVVLAFCAPQASARAYLEDPTFALLNATGYIDSRYSNDIYEDARLSVPELIRKYGYPMEIHHVTTEDGYILEMHRIPHGRDKNNDPNKKRPVVFVMHGLLCSSSAWVLMGPGSGFGYILAEEGFDVWMGNQRGNTYSRRHTHLNPDAIFNIKYWEFSWEEIGTKDLTAMIDYALKYTGNQRLHYIGHSQGTTAFFTMASLRPEYNAKISSMHALAPVAYMAHNRNPLLLAISPFASNIETMLPVIIGQMPAACSVRQLAHYGQGIAGKQFLRYDYGSRLANRRVYGTATPPRYPLEQITAPVFLHYSDNDPLAHVNDVDRLFRELGRPVGKFRVPLAAFTHIDFMWAIDGRELLYDRVMNLMAAVDMNTDIDVNAF